MENHHKISIFKNGKPSISMGLWAIFRGYVK